MKVNLMKRVLFLGFMFSTFLTFPSYSMQHDDPNEAHGRANIKRALEEEIDVWMTQVQRLWPAEDPYALVEGLTNYLTNRAVLQNENPTNSVLRVLQLLRIRIGFEHLNPHGYFFNEGGREE